MNLLLSSLFTKNIFLFYFFSGCGGEWGWLEMRISPSGVVDKVYKKVHFLKHIKKFEILLNKFKKTLDKTKNI